MNDDYNGLEWVGFWTIVVLALTVVGFGLYGLVHLVVGC